MATAPERVDAVLVRRLHERDRTAWADLYEAYGPRLRSFALRLTGNQHDADDLVSETFVRALPRLDSLDPDTVELGPYLFTTLRNLFLKTVERGKRVAPVEEVPEPVAPAPIEDDPERSTMLTAQQEGVRAANAKLAPRQRLVLALRELEDRSYAEIGEVVGLNENAVAQLISRARESLRTELRLAEVDPARLPEECRAFLPLLSRHLDGQLKGPQLERTLAHLEGCERCQDALSSMREASRRYRTLILLPGGDEAFAASIDAELTASGYWAGARRGGAARLRRRGAVIATAAALAVAGGAGVGAAVVLSGGPDALVAQTGITPPPTSTEAATSTETTAPPTTTRRPPRTAPATTAAVTTAPATTPAKPAPATTAPTTATTAPVTTTKPATTAPTTTTTTVAPKPPPPPPPPAIITPPPPPPPPLDRTAPTVTITARPPATTPTGEASFSFRASEAGSTFQCRLDGAAYTPCTSPKAYAGLGAGEHTFAVRARDRAGNLGAAATARWSFVPPDTTPPTVTITSAQISGGDASFSFASESGATFTCSLDGAGPVGCTSPAAYTGLGPGAHSFAVRATDAAGNVSEPATHAWTIAPPPAPDLVISQLTENSFVVTNIGNAPAGAFVVSVTLVGNFTFGGLAPGQSQTRTWSTCRRGTITAIADRGGTVAESNEGNNSRTITSDC